MNITNIPKEDKDYVGYRLYHKYCEKCGSELSEDIINSYYNITTGKKRYRIHKICFHCSKIESIVSLAAVFAFFSIFYVVWVLQR